MKLAFWFEFASTYSYPAAMRIEDAAAALGVEVTWRPFLLGPIFATQGWRDSPFNVYPAKGAYMWRDLDRVCAELGIPFQRPTVFPRSGLTAARIAVAAAEEPWLPAFVRAVYEANFAHDRDIAAPQVLADILTTLGQPAEALLAGAETTAVKQALRHQTAEAAGLGLFGAPSFIAGGDLFWGNDRLEAALSAAAAAG
jgi:2-hydroxychromene-2-carboxylate isomerase